MRKYKLIQNIFLVFLLLSIFYPSYSSENVAAIPPDTQDNTFLLPPIRRLGVDLVETNIDKFRIFMRKQDKLLFGIPALPYNEQDIEKFLANDVKDEIKNTGRFWDISLSELTKLFPLSNKQSNLNNTKNIELLKRQIENEYNIDAWLKPSVYFAPDQTLVRLVLKSSGIDAKILAREDITLEAQANEEKIKNSFSQALIKLINTLGHDGKITYTRENLLTIDFGIERGLVKGDTLYSGYIILTSFHPQTGEFLRTQRIPIHELKILESREGSSLCQIITSDRIAYEQSLKMLGTNNATMLVWRKPRNNYDDSWKEAYNPDIAPILGAADEGFEPVQLNQKKEEPPQSMIPPLIFEKQDKNETIVSQNQTKKDIVLKNQSDQQGLTNAIPPRDESTPKFPTVTYKKAIIKKPYTWVPYSTLLGTGVTTGYINGISSKYNSTLLNKFSASSFIDIDTAAEFKLMPYFQYSYFNTSQTIGSSTYLGATFFDTLIHFNQNDNFSLGASLEYTTGSIEYNSDNPSNTSIPTKTASLSNSAIMGNIMFDGKIKDFGNYNIIGGISVFDFVETHPIWSLKANLKPTSSLPENIVFDIGLKRFANNWLEFSIGVSWDFLDEFKYIKSL